MTDPVSPASRPTMKDVAQLAGVSLKTVSRHVNGQQIGTDFSKRIASAIEQLGYRRNLAAAALRPGQASMVLGMVISDLANPYFSRLADEVESVARRFGYLLMIASSDDEGATNDALIERLIDQRVDGLLVVPPHLAGRDWGRHRSMMPPTVSIDRPLGDEFDAVLMDDYEGGRLAAGALLANRPRRIAMITDSLAIHTMNRRHAGMVQAVAEDGSRAEMLVDAGAHTLAQAKAIALRLLDDELLDGIFAANNRSALGTLLAFRERGRRVPLVCLDDFEAATVLDPAVSVVSHDFTATAEAALDLLLRRTKGWDGPPEQVTIPVNLILRGSEKP
ncbi:MAG: LacI family transcriptional regulator [Propionibacteriaceae bacterium]|nr:LacI family transcriptional regulator [Propionibacteriaceae bacterium]